MQFSGALGFWRGQGFASWSPYRCRIPIESLWLYSCLKLAVYNPHV